MNPNSATFERTSDTELVFSRTLRAPPDVVFEAWTQPEHLRRWWAPASRGVTLVTCDVDLRPGGAYRWVIGRGDTERYAFSGKYIEITPPSRLVYTQSFEPMPGEAVVTVTFTEKGGQTLLHAHELYPSKEALDAAVSSGMEDGARETLDLLDDLVATLSRQV